jgi:hypothetical protein
MRALAVAAFLAIALPGAARADDPPAKVAPPPTTLAEWSRLDADAKWVKFRASNAGEDTWVRFLAECKDFAFLERIATWTTDAWALLALCEAKAPQFPRVAVWSLTSVDSHVQGAAERCLVETHPGLARAWFTRFRDAASGKAAGVAARLGAASVPSADASGFLPPLDPAAVYADLAAPADLSEMGDATAATPGRAYVHRVEWAIESLGRFAYRAGREKPLATLVTHPHPQVRRAAAQAWAYFPPESIPADLLTARLDDESEVPAVRSAAALGLSWSDLPSAYTRLLRVSTTPAHPAWRAAVSRLSDVDDGFAALVWAPDRLRLPAADAAFLAERVESIDQRVAATTDGDRLAARVVPMLERAAWSDLHCDPFEGEIVPWTAKTLHARATAHPEVRAALTHARDGYEPPDRPAASGSAAAREALRDRVRSYAGDILSGETIRAR